MSRPTSGTSVRGQKKVTHPPGRAGRPWPAEGSPSDRSRAIQAIELQGPERKEQRPPGRAGRPWPAEESPSDRSRAIQTIEPQGPGRKEQRPLLVGQDVPGLPKEALATAPAPSKPKNRAPQVPVFQTWGRSNPDSAEPCSATRDARYRLSFLPLDIFRLHLINHINNYKNYSKTFT